MPTLPTITVTDAQQTTILAAYKAHFGTTTTAETVAAYKKWLTQEIKNVVLNSEAAKLDDANAVTKRDQLAVVDSGLPDPNTAV